MATTAVLNLGLDSTGFNKGINKAETKVRKFEKTTSSLGVVMKAVFVVAMARAGWSMIKMASVAEETESKLNAVFKGIEKEATIVADSIADKFGLADSTIQEMLASTGDLLTGFGFAGGAALEMSANVAELAIDLKSFQNFSGGAKGASEAITSALLGETERMKSLGVVIRQNSKEFRNQVKEIRRLTGSTEQQAKAQAIWLQIQAQTKNAQGDALDTYTSTANRIDRMSEGWKTTQENMGAFLIEGLRVDKVVSSLADGMKTLSDNAHTFRLAIDSVIISLKSAKEKTTENVLGFVEKSLMGYKKAWAIITGDDVGLANLKERSKIQELTHQSMLKTIDKMEKDAMKKSVDKWAETEGRKKTITTKSAEEAIKTAIEKTKDGISSATQTPSTSADNTRRLDQFSGAFEKGSVEAYRVEKSSLGNKTERDNLRANKRTAEAVENSSNEITQVNF